MLRIVDIKNKSDNLLKDITKEISQLPKLNKNVEENKDYIQKIISSVHFKLNEYEYIQNLKPEENEIETKLKVKNLQNQKIIQRKLKIKTKKYPKQSKSFLRWLINNKEL
jgi:hypothetical protein